MKKESSNFNNSYERKIENRFQKIKNDSKTMAKDDFSLANMVVARKLLVEQLGLTSQLVKREEIKRKIIEKLGY